MKFIEGTGELRVDRRADRVRRGPLHWMKAAGLSYLDAVKPTPAGLCAYCRGPCANERGVHDNCHAEPAAL